ncbi:MAG: hypothetical protein KGN84_21220 [Acidobacteriota bacterium]|nr:hypothetical protein [Acidobacteriota bacterium]
MGFPYLRSVAVGCILGACLFAQDALSVPKLLEFIHSAIQEKTPDKDVASYLATIRLTQKLEDQTIEDLQTAGAGPRTVAALTKLADASASLPAAPPPPPPPAVRKGPPPPSKAEQDRVLSEIKEYALNYVKSLPDFLCLQVTRRSVDTHYQPGNAPAWTPQDILREKLSFVDHQEKYELLSANDTVTIGQNWKAVGGAISRGDWATLMESIFDPASETYFTWERWGNLRGKLYHVYRYQVDKAHSKETLDAENQRCTPAYHGEIFVPVDSSVIMRITVEPEPPADFPMQNVKEILSYNYINISGQPFLLPIASDVTMRTGRIGNRNEIAFRLYQKYSADTSIKFDTDDDPPAEADQPQKDQTTRKP